MIFSLPNLSLSHLFPIDGQFFKQQKKGPFIFIGASATKSWSMTRIFRFGLSLDFLSKGQKTKAVIDAIQGRRENFCQGKGITFYKELAICRNRERF